jgi:hypothetical protein
MNLKRLYRLYLNIELLKDMWILRVSPKEIFLYAEDFVLPSKWWTGCEDSLLSVPLAVRISGQYNKGISYAMM